MDDAGIITLYWQREQAAVTETDKKIRRAVQKRVIQDTYRPRGCGGVRQRHVPCRVERDTAERPRRLGAFWPQ